MDVGKGIKEYRKKRGLTQTQLGNLLGVAKSAICQIERGAEKNLTIDRLKTFADALGCSLFDLLDEKPKANEGKQTDFIEFRRGRKRYFVLKKAIVTVEECENQTFCAVCVAHGTGCLLVDGTYDEVIRKIKGGE